MQQIISNHQSHSGGFVCKQMDQWTKWDNNGFDFEILHSTLYLFKLFATELSHAKLSPMQHYCVVSAVHSSNNRFAGELSDYQTHVSQSASGSEWSVAVETLIILWMIGCTWFAALGLSLRTRNRRQLVNDFGFPFFLQMHIGQAEYISVSIDPNNYQPKK